MTDQRANLRVRANSVVAVMGWTAAITVLLGDAPSGGP
jgi:hypothetical protein